jgi:predicted carbohydrate-binding protein with CBM5 and CBM33 domain
MQELPTPRAGNTIMCTDWIIARQHHSSCPFYFYSVVMMSDKRTPKVVSNAAVQHLDGCTATMAYVGECVTKRREKGEGRKRKESKQETLCW